MPPDAGAELSARVAALDEHEALAVLELVPAGIVTWEVRRDRIGTPRFRQQPLVPWSSLVHDGLPDEAEFGAVLGHGPGSPRVVIVQGDAGTRLAREVLGRLRAARPQAQVFRSTVPLSKLIGEAVASAPLTRWYELVVLRLRRSGRLDLTGHLLFPPEAQRGYQQQLTVQCEPSDEHGIVFAVVARQDARQFELVSVNSARLAPGRYELTAELVQPGRVEFRGLPAVLHDDHRSWAELTVAIPERLPPSRAVHLICAVESSGPGRQVAERLSRIAQLIRHIGAGGRDQLRVSLASYGPHAVGRGSSQDAYSILSWAGSTEAALLALNWLRDHHVPERGYARAAQIECVLSDFAGQVDEHLGRPVIVTVGARPAFPASMDHTEIIPCPRPTPSDWRRALARLRECPGIKFGAIQDYGLKDEMWCSLGRDALARLDAVSMPEFATKLGLTNAVVQHLSFPLVNVEGA